MTLRSQKPILVYCLEMGRKILILTEAGVRSGPGGPGGLVGAKAGGSYIRLLDQQTGGPNCGQGLGRCVCTRPRNSQEVFFPFRWPLTERSNGGILLESISPIHNLNKGICVVDYTQGYLNPELSRTIWWEELWSIPVKYGEVSRGTNTSATITALLEVVHSNRGVIGDGGVVNKTKSVKQVPNKKKDARIGGHSGDGRGASVLRLQRRADTASQILTRMASEDPQRRQSRLTGWVLGRPAFSYGGSTESQQSPLAAASQAAKPLVLPELGPDRALYHVVLAVFTVASVDHSIHPPPSSDPKNSASSKLLLPSPPLFPF
ncbi:hypothetical protein ASPNIDRAFT_38731 [Aspergillus niger ATCC 1015]|uniref:Uncharacterized protein n=1 Tax=Aspergillus niger (strain ATCC 1015 / CBS 113.46 / FGSC A1144 / LSHB Ac4 / NCTC 3858a / NRRL 328 / USDA 3528.7) TaxID=380704 RepID=G3YBL9_ASPNA|nr:hypothetical protein ASPNIDRAFT_38731 [Aspergillus niger ATCC 1015]